MKNNGVFYNITTVANLLGISRQAVYNRMKAGELPNRKDANRGQVVPSNDIRESRRIERDRLVERLDALDVLDTFQYKMDEIERSKLELGV